MLFRNVAERKIDSTGFKPIERQAKTCAAFVLDPLYAVKQALLKVVAAEDLQIAVAKPLLQGDPAVPDLSFAADELKQGALAEGKRDDGPEFKVLVFADAGAVNSTSVLDAVSVKVDQAGVQGPPLRDIHRGKRVPDDLLRTEHNPL